MLFEVEVSLMKRLRLDTSSSGCSSQLSKSTQDDSVKDIFQKRSFGHLKYLQDDCLAKEIKDLEFQLRKKLCIDPQPPVSTENENNQFFHTEENVLIIYIIKFNKPQLAQSISIGVVLSDEEEMSKSLSLVFQPSNYPEISIENGQENSSPRFNTDFGYFSSIELPEQQYLQNQEITFNPNYSDMEDEILAPYNSKVAPKKKNLRKLIKKRKVRRLSIN